MIKSWDGFTRLREVWLGDVYPAHFYDHLESEVRDTFRTITEWTKEDLGVIENKLKSFGIIVRRPCYDSPKEAYMQKGVLVKPAITPRDHFLVNGDQLIGFLEYMRPDDPWKPVIDIYREAGANLVHNNTPFHLSGAMTVRLGRDFYLDCVYINKEKNYSPEHSRSLFEQHIAPMFPNQRCHYIDNGGHVDSCFALLKPGALLATRYFDSYDEYFPGWQRITLSEPEFHRFEKRKPRDPRFLCNGNWWLPGKVLPYGFNEYVIKYAQDWIGYPQETFFEVNCLVIDPQNVMVLGSNQEAFRRLKALGFTVHEIPFRCRTFWDGGLHCLTLDIRRDGELKDYMVSI